MWASSLSRSPLRRLASASAKGTAQTLVAPPSPDDLFGLKRSALDGLRRTLRPVKAHAFGWLVVSRLHADLVEHDEAEAAARAGDLGETRVAGARLAPLGDRMVLEAGEEL